MIFDSRISNEKQLKKMIVIRGHLKRLKREGKKGFLKGRRLLCGKNVGGKERKESRLSD